MKSGFVRYFFVLISITLFVGWLFLSETMSEVVTEKYDINIEIGDSSSQDNVADVQVVDGAVSVGKDVEFAQSEVGAKILFGGDVMLDRQMRTLARTGGVENFLDDAESIFANWDAVVLNLEGVVGERASVSEGQPQSNPAHFKFTFSPETVKSFVAQIASPLIVADGNNHSLDFGYDGLRSSRDWYVDNGLEFFGDIRRGQESFGNQVLRKTIGEREISFVSYNAFLGNALEQTYGLIKLEAKAGRDVIVYTHWGTEYLRKVPVREQVIARKFVDAGARLVIGVHPHVIQPMEVYKNSVIFYSLGNFVFDQFFSRDVQERLAVGCELRDEATNCQLIFLKQGRTNGLEFVSAEREQQLRKWFAQNSLISDKARQDIIEDSFIFIKQ